MSTKESGLGFSVAVDNALGAAKTISNDVLSLNFSTPRAEQDVTGVDKSANERLLLLADMQVDLTVAFNDAADQAHSVFSTVSSTSVARTTTLGISGKSLPGELLYTDYSFSRSASGEFVATCPGVLADGTVPTWA